MPLNLLKMSTKLAFILFLDYKEEIVKTVVEELDQLGNVLSLRVHSVEKRSSKIKSSITTEQQSTF